MSPPPPNRESCAARYVPPDAFKAGFGKLEPGSFTIRTDDDGKRWLDALLPGRHYAVCNLKPESPNGWLFNESTDSPTLQPSIKVTGYMGQQPFERWHGFLISGRFVSC